MATPNDKETSCKDLFKIFNGVGSSLECRYDTKKCTMYSNLLQSILECKIQPNDGKYIDRELWVYAARHDELVKHIPNTKKTPIEKLHNYQEPEDIGIKFLSYVEH
jgi:hypothetical protein